MPRASQASPQHQLVKALVIGEGKCGKSDWAARAAEAGFNVLYMDADVGSQTIAGLTRDEINPVNPSVLDRIFILNCSDELVSGALDYRFVNMFKKFCTASPTFRWNDTQGREFSISQDGDPCADEIWEIKPAAMDHNSVLVIDSWTALAQSAMNWACDELGLDPIEISEAERVKMRGVYQAAGEKLTMFLQMIRSARCHVIVIGHPREFTKTEKTPGKSVAQRESDMKVLWTKMVVRSSSNNHAFEMPKYFTDLAWIEVDAMGRYMIDFRASNDRISGSHFNARVNTRNEGSFANLVKHVGGTLPNENGGPASIDSWLTIHESGFSLGDATKKPGLVLGGKSAPASTVKGVGGLSLLKK